MSDFISGKLRRPNSSQHMHARHILVLMNLDSNPLLKFASWGHEMVTSLCRTWSKW